ncbi:MAG: replication-associated recombination protein A, partial [Vicinamibacterales bacterium]
EGLFGAPAPAAPLAERLRPRAIDEVLGQRHLLGPGRPLRLAFESGKPHSMILWGPPGTGKTTLARLMAQAFDAEFIALPAVFSGVKDIRDAVSRAENALAERGRSTILFVDEVHRFNKAQQDAFLPYVEKGLFTFIGATTENPSFEVNSALLSRSKVHVLKALGLAEITAILRRALEDDERGLGTLQLSVDDEALTAIAKYANGDARVALNLLETAASTAGESRRIDTALVADLAQNRALLYDKSGEEHYNLVSALHKSIRNSDPDAAVYWLARMLEAGEDPMYVARRLVRFASEDIGNADPQALTIAVAAKDAVHFLGMPEGSTALAQAAIYMAVASKSNAVYRAYLDAAEAAAQEVAEPVPLHLRNAPTTLMKQLEYGKDYRYAHDETDGVARGMECLPPAQAGRRFYEPTERGLEARIKQRLAEIRKTPS